MAAELVSNLSKWCALLIGEPPVWVLDRNIDHLVTAMALAYWIVFVVPNLIAFARAVRKA